MGIIALQITPAKDSQFQTQATTLDEMTRELPQGFYTTFSTLSHGTKVFGLHAHLLRLYNPAMKMGVSPSVDPLTLRTRIAEIVRLNLPKESRIRVILTKNNGKIYVGVQSHEPLSNEIYQHGVMVNTTELVRQTPRIKDTGFISSSIDQRKQVGRDVFEILLTRKGQILEGMTSNFYASKGKNLITAQRGILLGVTRRVILHLARGQEMSIEYRPPYVNENFDEAFLTSSSRGVVPIISIDKIAVGQGKVGRWTKILSKAYQSYIEERSERIAD
jgi:branched-chain amino acid aminotransferase